MIAISNDHGGVSLKKIVCEYLEKNGHLVKDYGACSSDSVDYPDYAIKAAKAVVDGECEFGILICGTGTGISIAANKVPGIRAANCTNSYMARMSREHNNANILALGERVLGTDLAIDIIETWLKTPFAGGRHQIRLNKISEIENNFNRSGETNE